MRIKAPMILLGLFLIASPVLAEGGAPNPHLTKAIELRGQANSAYDAGDYDHAALLARQAKAELALLGRAAPAGAPPAAEATTLPASYTVRYIPGNRDCLSKIAGFPFIYGDRTKWVELYKANKTTLRHPENADLLLPGEILVIPSIAGESREGAWSSEGAYPTFKDK